jgi:hypothetical protein
MQNSINCADRNTERSGDFFDSTCFRSVVHRVRSRDKVPEPCYGDSGSDAQSFSLTFTPKISSQPRAMRSEVFVKPTRREFLRGGLALAALEPKSQAALAADPASPHTLWYTSEAQRWQEALPIGNGRVGGMVFGGITQERIALTELTAWSGAPGRCITEYLRDRWQHGRSRWSRGDAAAIAVRRAIHLLPALPVALSKGSVSGLCARDEFQVEIQWRFYRLVSAAISSNRSASCLVRYEKTFCRFG